MRLRRWIRVAIVVWCVMGAALSVRGASAGRIPATQKAVPVRVFHAPQCHSCMVAIHDVIPAIAVRFGDLVRWEYVDITQSENLPGFLEMEQRMGRKMGTPTVVVGDKILIGLAQVSDQLESAIAAALEEGRLEEPVKSQRELSIEEVFRSFGAVAVIGAGLADGINPCAFTVIVFFVSFLSVMGYRRREMAVIGSVYILAVFLTYLGIGFGFFRLLYMWKDFRLVSKVVYILVGGMSLFLGFLALRDYWIYKRTGNTDDMALSLPPAIKNRIHKIVGEYYRRDKTQQRRALLRLAVSSFVVGFLISLLESVCTGQLYLPTIIFLLKEGGLRVKALVYLLVYNVMFVIPLVGVLVFALVGVNSRQFEGFARRHLGSVKLTMAAVFLALGLVLLWGS